MIVCKELNKEFTTDIEMFKALRENKDMIISEKKSQIYKSFEKGQGVKAKTIDPTKFIETSKGLMTDDNYWYFAVNSTKILDSHNDLHKDGIWNKTSKDQEGKNYLVDTHVMSMNTTIANKENIEILIATVPFSAIGKSYSGNTQLLIYKVKKTDIRIKDVSDWLNDGYDIEGSVRMQYVTIELAMNSKAKDDKVEFKAYNDNINDIANKSEFDNITHFWIVSEAKNVQESSLVLNGSNGATGIIDNKNIQPSNDTDKNEPLKNTQTESKAWSITDIIN